MGQFMDPDVLTVGARFGRYIIEDVRGYGSFGVVYAARREDLPRKVALKVLHRHLARNHEVVARFRTEATTIAELRHPHIVDVLDVGAHEGVPFLAMEFLEGETLRELLDREQRLNLPDALDLLIPIFSAVAAVHARGVVHRDLKPDNVMLAQIRPGKVQVKLLDFGVAKVLDGKPGMTRTGVSVGTPYFMSPEQAEEAREADASSDQWSLAVMLYRSVTGRYPFDGRTVLQILNAVIGRDPDPPSTWTPEGPIAFDLAVLRALSKHPDERFESVRAFGAVLLPMASPRTVEDWDDEFGVAARRGPARGSSAAPPAPKPRPITMPMPVWEDVHDEPTHVRAFPAGVDCAVAPLSDVDTHDTIPGMLPPPPPDKIRPVEQGRVRSVPAPAPMLAAPTSSPPRLSTEPSPSGTISMSPRSLAAAVGASPQPVRSLRGPTVVLGIVAFVSVVSATYAVHLTHKRRLSETTGTVALPRTSLPVRTAPAPDTRPSTVVAPTAALRADPPDASPPEAPPPETLPSEMLSPRDGRHDRSTHRASADTRAAEQDASAPPPPATEGEEAPEEVPNIDLRPRRSEVRRVLDGVAGQIRACASDASGELVLRMSLNPDGYIEDLQFRGIPLEGAASACIEQLLRGVAFPMSLQGAPTADYPLAMGSVRRDAPRRHADERLAPER